MQGLFGVHCKGPCIETLFLGTFGLQHRGQCYAGLATSNGEGLKIRTHRGLVGSSFENDLAGFEGNVGIGVTSSIDRQPIQQHSLSGKFIVGADCCVKNADQLREAFFSSGHSFSSEADIELIATLIAEKRNFGEGLTYALEKVAGPCNILLLANDGIYAGSDWQGFKPLAIGRRDDDWAVSSGTCAFNNGSGFKYVRNIEPGEVIFIGEEGPVTVSKSNGVCKKCSFEPIYFAEPDSEVWGIPVTRVRHNLGANLAKADKEEFDFSADDTVVGGVPNSGNAHAEGYHLESKLPHLALFKPPKYVLRTYNLPLTERKRQKARKLSPIKENIEEKRVILVDDSIRSAITIMGIVKLLFDCGAKEVHVRIACPNSIRYCPYDYPPLEEEDFIAATKSKEEIRQAIGATSLHFQKFEDVAAAIGLPQKDLCLDCFLSGHS